MLNFLNTEYILTFLNNVIIYPDLINIETEINIENWILKRDVSVHITIENGSGNSSNDREECYNQAYNQMWVQMSTILPF